MGRVGAGGDCRTALAGPSHDGGIGRAWSRVWAVAVLAVRRCGPLDVWGLGCVGPGGGAAGGQFAEELAWAFGGLFHEWRYGVLWAV